MIGRKEIYMAREYIEKACYAEGVEVDQALADIGVDENQLVQTAAECVDSWALGMVKDTTSTGVGVAAIGPMELQAFFVGVFLCGYVAGRWEEHDNNSALEGIDLDG